LNFVNGSSIFLEFGKPSLPGEYRLYFSLAIRLVPELDSTSHKFEELFEMPVSGEHTAAHVKEIVCEQLKTLKNIEVDPKKIRLRERISERMLKVYRDVPLRNQGIFEKKQIAVELLDHEEKVGPKEALILIRFWDPEKMELSSIMEIVIDKNENLLHFAKRIYEKDQRLKIEEMEACRIVAIYNFARSDLLTQEWSPLNDENNMLYNHPFYISNDGFTIFVKDKNKNTEFTEEDKKKLGILNQKSKRAIYQAPQEKSLKITIKKKEDDKIIEETIETTMPKGNGMTDADARVIETLMNKDIEEETVYNPEDFRPLID